MPRENERTLRDRLLSGLTRDLAFKGSSLFFAVAVWAWVQSELVVEKKVRANLAFTWPPSL
ncbi:MAG: hypothetical protein QGG40_14240, partial [Myxococcota bacterium]|nr:hypothetical protein [Myxococcota bacterium]